MLILSMAVSSFDIIGPQRVEMANKNRNSITSSTDIVRRALRTVPRMPLARQRRLYELIARGKQDRLSARERRELRSLLDEVDRRSFAMLKDAMVSRRPRSPKQVSRIAV